MSDRCISTISRTALKQKDESIISRYLLSLRPIDNEIKPHDSRTAIERNLTFLSRKNHHGYY
jgi:hypothetical protein